MRLALLSDIHSNLHALQACLNHLETQHTDRIAFLGDMVGYGASPLEVLQTIESLQQTQEAIVLQGNHDAMAVEPPDFALHIGDMTADWTHRQITAAQQRWLHKLPLQRQLEDVLMQHASADAPQRWRYVSETQVASDSLQAAAPEVRWVVGGHVHQQLLYYRSQDGGVMRFTPQPGVWIPVGRHRQWLITAGSVGQPRDGNPDAMYAILDTDQAQLIFHRVEYDYHAAAQAIRQAGLPEFFAARLEDGR